MTRFGRWSKVVATMFSTVAQLTQTTEVASELAGG
jgi:hypothetical protein